MPKKRARKNRKQPAPSPWPRRWAMALCLLTFPLLWVGGLVTSTGAGMAVPDWPSTYGYNMFAYPWQTWLFGPWDLMVEHGHRLLASAVGLIAIGLVVAVCRTVQAGWLRWLSVAALALVIFQGVLGGARVIENERQLAMAHGCIGPLFFALTAVLLAGTSRSWQQQGAAIRPAVGGLLLATAIFAYLQLFLGAQLRHVPVDTSPWAFAGLVKLHLVMAGVVTLHVLAAVAMVFRSPNPPAVLRRLTAAMGLLVLFQLGLGVATWLVKYGAPGWAEGWLPVTMEANMADGWAQTHLATAHSACGSLILALASAAAAYCFHFAKDIPSPSSPAVTAVAQTA